MVKLNVLVFDAAEDSFVLGFYCAADQCGRPSSDIVWAAVAGAVSLSDLCPADSAIFFERYKINMGRG